MTQPETPARRRGRPKIPREVQERRLLDGAGIAFQKHGYEGTRVADIVAEAGMSSRSFYEFFESKEDLVASVVAFAGRAFVARLQEIFEQTEDPVERIDRGLHAFLDLFAQVPIDIESFGGSAGRKLREVRRDYVLQITELVLGALGPLYERRAIDRAPDPILVELVLTGIEGMTFRYYSEGRHSELAALHPTVMQLLIRAFLR